RYYDNQTSFDVNITDFSSIIPFSFPDKAPNNDTGGWHHYAITFDHGSLMGYFDGTNFASYLLPNQFLSVGGVYLRIAVCTFHVDPCVNFEGHPNNAWMNGALDDIRIYNRTFSGAEIFNLYTNCDNQAPTAPSNFKVRTDSSTQTELYWNASTDNFR